jgi:hypothetical protein
LFSSLRNGPSRYSTTIPRGRSNRTRGELLLQRAEAHQHVRDHFRLVFRTDARGDDPWQEFGIAAHVRHQIEHLFGRPGQAPLLGDMRHARSALRCGLLRGLGQLRFTGGAHSRKSSPA